MVTNEDARLAGLALELALLNCTDPEELARTLAQHSGMLIRKMELPETSRDYVVAGVIAVLKAEVGP